MNDLSHAERWEDTNLCDDCLYFIAYGSLGDDSTPDADAAHGLLMLRTLGGVALAFSCVSDSDGDCIGEGFSHSGCEGCGKRSCNVHSGTLLVDTQALKGLRL
jgi:hypothetical protein